VRNSVSRTDLVICRDIEFTNPTGRAGVPGEVTTTIVVNQRTQPLGIEPLAQRSGAGQVAEEHGDRLALLPGLRSSVSERKAALLAELRALAVVVTTARADRHR
jgi:hypothetical protein